MMNDDGVVVVWLGTQAFILILGVLSGSAIHSFIHSFIVHRLRVPVRGVLIYMYWIGTSRSRKLVTTILLQYDY
jgi:hypothetical protein